MRGRLFNRFFGQFNGGVLPLDGAGGNLPPQQQAQNPLQNVNAQNGDIGARFVGNGGLQAPQPPGAGNGHPLRPPQQFQGFWLPGGQWQPWPNDPPHQAYTPPGGDSGTDGQAGNANGNVPVNSVVSTSSPSGANAAEAPGDRSGGVSEGNGASNGAQDTPSTNPREAAAMAAMRRFSSKGTTSTTRSTSSSSSSENTMTNERPPDNAEASSSAITVPTPTRPSLPSRQNTQTSFRAPPLIPLFNTSATSPSTSSGNRPPLLSIRESQRRLLLNRAANASFETGQQPRTVSGYPWARAPPLPPQLTEEQLAVMDRLTREAIDERLRLLENVQIMSSRAMSDLMRCRSVLPPLEGTPSTSSGDGILQPSGSGTETAVQETAAASSEERPQQEPQQEQAPPPL